MINVIANVFVKEGKAEEFLEIFCALVPSVLAEDGCIAYGPTRDVDSGMGRQVFFNNCFAIVEKWESLDALKAHDGASHMKAYGDQVKDLVEKVTLQITEDIL